LIPKKHTTLNMLLAINFETQLQLEVAIHAYMSDSCRVDS